MFFFAVYISGSLIFGVVFSVISVSTLFTPYLPFILTLGMSLLLISKATFNLDSVVIELGFILDAVYNYFFVG